MDLRRSPAAHLSRSSPEREPWRWVPRRTELVAASTAIWQPPSVMPSRPRLKPAGMLPASICLMTSRSEEHTSELQSLMRTSYAVFCLKNKILDILTTIYITANHSHANHDKSHEHSTT